MRLAEFHIFLNGLTDDSIDHAMACFKEGLSTLKVYPDHFDTQGAQINCHRILRMTEKGSIATGMVCNIPRFWANIEGLVHSSNMTTVETTMTRVYCMQGALKFRNWLQDVIPAAISRTSDPNHKPKSWIDRLATDVQLSLLKPGNSNITFHSSDYLPNLAYGRQYTVMTSKRVQYDNVKQLTSIMFSTLQCWLHFPPDEDSFVQLGLLDIVLTGSLPSILFLDKIWEMYKTPFGTVFNNDWALRRSKSKLTATLDNFEKKFASHPFAKPDSSSYVKLQDLSQLISQWMKHTGVDESNTSNMVSIHSIMIDYF